MATHAKALRALAVSEQPERLVAIPSPAKVRARAAKIRRGWTKTQRRRRAQLARYLVWRQLLGGT
jgi:hypothetical protein